MNRISRPALAIAFSLVILPCSGCKEKICERVQDRMLECSDEMEAGYKALPEKHYNWDPDTPYVEWERVEISSCFNNAHPSSDKWEFVDDYKPCLEDMDCEEFAHCVLNIFDN